MANAIPVNTPVPAVQAEPSVETMGGELTEAELLKRGQEIVAAEKPVKVLDEQVNQIGQLSVYGNIAAVKAIPYEAVDRKGNPTGEMRTHIRVDH